MANIQEIGKSLLLAFSVAAAGSGIFSSIKGGAYELGTDNYNIAERCELKIKENQPCSQQELQTLVDVKHNETREGEGLARVIFGSLGILAAQKKKITIQPA